MSDESQIWVITQFLTNNVVTAFCYYPDICLNIWATGCLHKTSTNTHEIWIRELATWAYFSSFLAPSYIVFFLSSLQLCAWQTVFTCKQGHWEGRDWTGRDEAWVISFQCVQVTSYYPQDSPWPLLSQDRFPAITCSHDRAIHVTSHQRWSMSATCCEAKNLQWNRQMYSH